MWIEELKRDLIGRSLDIWRGHDDAGKPIDLLPEKQEAYRKLWREQTGAPQPPSSQPTPRQRCRHLDDNPIQRSGCGSCQRKWTYPCAVYGEAIPANDCDHCTHHQPDDDTPDKFPAPLILKNQLCPGDSLVMSAAIESLHRAYPGEYVTDVEGTAAEEIYQHNPHVRKLTRDVRDKAHTVVMQYPLVHQSGQRCVHFMQGYCDYLGEQLGRPLPLLTNRPHLYLSEEEKGWISQVAERGHKGSFWVLNAGVKDDYTTKQWPFYQHVVDALQGKVQFVQVGQKHHKHKAIKGVINLVGKTSTRELIRLIHNARGVLTGVSFPMHIAAALEKPSVVLAGGREPVQWNAYPKQTYLHTLGALPCCENSACWRSRVLPLLDNDPKNQSLCEHPLHTDPPAPKCMGLITPDDVIAAVLRYSVGRVSLL